ncbi:hypothetical protein I4U23_007816 [Adineta vaga]|nr:hypothetical protein I4U23_007816 [Adineta vaga]
MFWVFYMMFSIFRSHRNRFYWRDGKLHFVKQNRQLQQQKYHHDLRKRKLTRAEEQQSFKHSMRQWFIFYSVLATIIIAILLYRLNVRPKTLS